MKAFGAALLAALLVGGTPARAQIIDVSSMRCKEFAESSKDTIAVVMLWLEGYFTDEEDPAVIDLERVKSRTDRLVARCAQNPGMKLLAAADDIMDK